MLLPRYDTADERGQFRLRHIGIPSRAKGDATRWVSCGPEYADSFDRVFLTPQGLDLAAVASALGWDAVRVGSVDELQRALAGWAEFIVASL